MEGAPVLHDVFMPFTEARLARHFPEPAAEHVRYYVESLRNYRKFESQHPDRRGVPLTEARRPAQVEKDERFWIAAALMTAQDQGGLAALMDECMTAPDGGSWTAVLGDHPTLCFEARLPSPGGYRAWLRGCVDERQPVAYVRDAARRRGSDEVRPNLEGATRADAVVSNPDTGARVLFEAKVLSDISGTVSYDALRNQLIRNIDVMLDDACSWFVLLTPELFRANPTSRLYGHLMQQYRDGTAALRRDLPHRSPEELAGVPGRLGWLTFEDVARLVPDSCRWLR